MKSPILIVLIVLCSISSQAHDLPIPEAEFSSTTDLPGLLPEALHDLDLATDRKVSPCPEPGAPIETINSERIQQSFDERKYGLCHNYAEHIDYRVSVNSRDDDTNTCSVTVWMTCNKQAH